MVFGTLNDDSKEIANSIVGNAVVVIAATALRFWCQARNQQRGIRSFHPDDWFLLATSLSYLGAGSVAIYGLFCGRLPEDLSYPLTAEEHMRRSTYLKSLFVGQTIIFLTFFLAKLTVCTLYRRIFKVHYIRRSCLYLTLASSIWFAVAEVTDFCICIPPQSFWYASQRGRCLNINGFLLLIGIIEVLLDVAILILPVRVVLGLQMPRRAKFTVSGIFLMGIFSVLANILRIYYQYVRGSTRLNMKNAVKWCAIHGAVTLVCACLPVYTPLKEILGRLCMSLQEKYAQVRCRLSPTRASSCVVPACLNGRAQNMRETGSSVVDEAWNSNENTSDKAAHNQTRRSDFLPPLHMVHSDLYAVEHMTTVAARQSDFVRPRSLTGQYVESKFKHYLYNKGGGSLTIHARTVILIQN